MTVATVTVESQHDDLLAEKTFDAFKNELNEWWIENASRRDDEDLRGQVADDFTEVRRLVASLVQSSRIHVFHAFITICPVSCV